MKTLVLLSALALLAFQVQADPIQNRDEESKIDEQPGKEDQAVSVSFGDPEGSSLQEECEDLICYCRTRGCKRRERLNGTCRKGHLMYMLWCC
ncbi:alpha-defensin 25 precursor [Mus musculus]|uniref:Alpha-defensin 25 n=1 Tax=Mus musculus TaxID=10090 RepID=DFA25_MOUSE|nr:alpha-defensin 25 precursor [Mus musculus]Q5G864.1 RecName: Full=Alpha-defensin 25; AltName: Full=Defensin-related cryptdin-25; Flags: Precursor [Mus musculus]AAW78339.1 defensin-related cryptdin 25 [Mus musculus]|eukprot:NP_031875.1 alpha-defensin 25 precursor [Mus musculus]